MDKLLLSILAGLGGMLGWGISDFLANNASGQIGHSKAFLWSQLAGLTLIAILCLFLSSSFSISTWLLVLAMIGGVAYALGYLFFYKGFEIGNVSVVSAVVNLQVIFIVGISLWRGQHLSVIQFTAIILLIFGATLVSVDFGQVHNGAVSLLKGVKETLFAAIMFGVFYYPINEYVAERADWLAVSFIVKLVAVIFVLMVFALNRQSLKIFRPTKRLWIALGFIGILEAFGVLSVTYGLSFGDGVIVAPISSSLTVVTVGLAIVFLHERINKLQAVGIAMVIISIVTIAL